MLLDLVLLILILFHFLSLKVGFSILMVILLLIATHTMTISTIDDHNTQSKYQHDTDTYIDDMGMRIHSNIVIV